MFQSLDLLALSFLLLMVKSQQDTILPPQNVSLRWINDFRPALSWSPPQHSMKNCYYKVQSETTEEDSEKEHITPNTTWDAHIVMEGGYLWFSVETVCEGNSSTKVVKKTNYTDLVKDLQCYSHSAKQTHCFWLPDTHAPDLKFYYQLQNEDFTVTANGKSPFNLTECLEYRYTDGVRTGCNLEATISQSIAILLNGTHNNSLARNTFKKWPKKNMRPPALNWTFTETWDHFLNISWTPPDIPVQWTYKINYTECDEVKILSSSVRLDGERWWTAIFRSLQRCSIGFRSGLWLGQSRMVTELFRSHSFVILAVCLGSLSCWKVNLRPSLRS
ncbi:uncharacterized protein LOC144534007 isoform X2 [Sander vitreus]